ncbi:hypothetical protein FA09DRAFT_331522 [Tilletiopsis washingtonensis]|uniref:DUF952-domain-containing protein n=1 Tax=Tilletiopsis washingtonensis TaxID=58919 RepID=A0A316Z5Q4_9BASI|nr:hypothetical protein FA09DRAFT_331522 [Tilletiopsis washingtonensis]PWN96298.1 hypothetical protein FA09DRAFT_331522 [Tilletiopsis washingtonensis]
MTSPPSRECTHLYKILTPQEHNALPQRAWKGTEFDQNDGFIHLSTSTQLRATLSRFFADTTEVVLVCIPREKLERHDAGELKFELAPSVGDEFGHIYGTIEPQHFLWTRAVHQADGSWEESRLGELPF